MHRHVFDALAAAVDVRLAGSRPGWVQGRLCAAVALLFALLPASTSAERLGPPRLLLDLDTQDGPPRSGQAYGFTEMGGVLYYGAWEEATGYELWRTDMTDEGTHLVTDIHPGSNSSLPKDLTAIGNTLYFTAFDGKTGFGLWKTDGTADGTVLVKGADEDFRHPGQLANLGGVLLLTAYSTIEGTQLWKSDGTADGTQPVAPLTGRFGRPRLPIAVADSQAFVFSRDAQFHAHLWSTDGTPGGTQEIWQGATAGPSDRYAALGGQLLFRGPEGLLVTDGTGPGTTLLGAFSSPPDWFTAVGSSMFFTAGTGSLGITDGTGPGTTVIAMPSPTARLTSLVTLAGKLYFVSTDPPGAPALWVSDGTPGGTALLDTLTGAMEATLSTGSPSQILVAACDYATPTCTLAASPGTPGGLTVLRAGLKGWAISSYTDTFGDGAVAATVSPLSLRPQFGSLSGETMFRARATVSPLFAPFAAWVTDGTADGTRAAFAGLPTNSSAPQEAVASGATLFFTAGPRVPVGPDGMLATQLWAYRSGAPPLLLDSTQGLGGLSRLAGVGGRAFYMRYEYFNPGRDLWTSMGSVATTRLLKPNLTGIPVQVGARVIFSTLATSGPKMVSLWSADVSGTVRSLGACDLPPFSSEVFQGMLYFSCGVTGVWRTNGQSAPTQLVAGLGVTTFSASSSSLYFQTTDPVTDELWRSDGTAAGTHVVAPIPHDTSRLTAVGTRAFFTADDPAFGRELWVSNGTAEGTRLLKDIRPGPESSDPDGLVEGPGGLLFFTADDGQHGSELWCSDGRQAGTRLVADILPGPRSALGEGPVFTVLRGVVVFPGFRPGSGVELFASNGRYTRALAEILPGAGSSNPQILAGSSTRIFLAADDGTHGRELWRIDALP